MAPIRVLVVSDDPLARAGLVARLAGEPEVAVAGEAGVAEAAEVEDALAPAAVLWDLGPAGAERHDPGFSSSAPPAAGRGEAGRGDAALPLVALAADEAAAAEALRAGARAVLSRAAPGDVLAAALAAAVRGLAVLDPRVAEGFIRPPEDAPAEGLTSREGEVLALLAEGLSNKAIAARLGISEHTAKFHVNAILGKLGAESRAAAIVKAARLGLVAL